jgi:cellulose synthase/poly-beta-1,6-N-acetylglucosamine synthase-like glycosyltransferase
LIDRRQIDTSRLRPKGFKILLEIVATHHKLLLSEVPLQFAKRKAGESHGNLKQGKEFFGQLLNLRFRRAFRTLYRLPKFIQFGLIGGAVFVVGMILLAGLVEVLGWSPLVANAVQLMVTFWLNYVLNQKITWRERALDRLTATKFFVSRAATTVINYGLFAWLISLSMPINYLLANVIALMLITALNFVISDRWVFTNSENGLSPWSVVAAGLAAVTVFCLMISPALTAAVLIMLVNLLLFGQACMEVWRMMYAYRIPESVDQLRFPVSATANERFGLIVPARNEADVLASTLKHLARQTHPSVDVLVVICSDDYDTLRVAYETAEAIPRIRVVQYPLQPGAEPNKPSQLNHVFDQIPDKYYSVIGVMDAEDTVHPELLARVDAAFRDPSVGIVQGGVQLMNHDSSWYSLHNVLEYYRWFNSVMPFQAANQFMPLGGNTVFIRESLLRQAGGWPVTLTEDCSLGVQLSSRFQATTKVYYEPRLATREETPSSLKSLFKQRVRWNQGFFHEWKKGVWRELPSRKQRLLANYVLFGPVMLAGISIFTLFSLFAATTLTAPVILVLLMYLPLIPTTLLVVMNAIFLYDFGKAYDRKVTIRQYLTLFVSQIPYQIMLNTAAVWSVLRELRGETSWYKTKHTGQHRLEPALGTPDLSYLASASFRKVDHV